MNPLANDTTSVVPQAPEPVVKVEKQVKAQPENAIPIPDKIDKHRKVVAEPKVQSLFRPPEPYKSNQVYSNVPQAAVSPMYGMKGSAGIDLGPDSVLGTQIRRLDESHEGPYCTALEQGKPALAPFAKVCGFIHDCAEWNGNQRADFPTQWGLSARHIGEAGGSRCQSAAFIAPTIPGERRNGRGLVSTTMMRKSTLITLILLAVMTAAALFAQDITSWINGQGGKPALAVIDFRGTGTSQPFMEAFNSTLFTDLQSSGLFDMKAKSLFPLNNPQRPEDLRPDDNGQGFALQDWSGAPLSASHLVFGYAAAVNGSFALYGNVDDARQANPQSAQLMAQRYAGSLDQAGAIRAAHEFASDIIQKFGGSASLLGSRIYYVRRTGTVKAPVDELWVMDWDGGNPKQLTRLENHSEHARRFAGWQPRRVHQLGREVRRRIMMLDTLSGRMLPFYNQEASVNSQASFTPDGKQIYYASSAAGLAQIYVADIDGQGFRRISHRDAIEAEPKVNPKNPNLLLMVSGPRASADLSDEFRRLGRPDADQRRRRVIEPFVESGWAAHRFFLDARLCEGRL